jgi:hypothetical protein
MAETKAQAEAQMQKIGDLPDGRALYYADEETFGENGGLKVWDPDHGDHVPVVVVSQRTIEELRGSDFDFSIELASVKADPDQFAKGVLIRTDAAPANGRGYFLIRVTLPETV